MSILGIALGSLIIVVVSLGGIISVLMTINDIKDLIKKGKKG